MRSRAASGAPGANTTVVSRPRPRITIDPPRLVHAPTSGPRGRAAATQPLLPHQHELPLGLDAVALRCPSAPAGRRRPARRTAPRNASPSAPLRHSSKRPPPQPSAPAAGRVPPPEVDQQSQVVLAQRRRPQPAPAGPERRRRRTGGHALGSLAHGVAARMQDLLRRARTPESVDRVDRPSTPHPRLGTRSRTSPPPDRGTGAASRGRAAAPLSGRLGELRAPRRGSGTGRRSRPSAPWRCPRPATPPRAPRRRGRPRHVEPEPLVLERVDELVRERELEQRPRHAGVADHDQPLRAVVVEARAPAPGRRGRAPARGLSVGRSRPSSLAVSSSIRCSRRGYSDRGWRRTQLDRLVAVEEQGPDGLR